MVGDHVTFRQVLTTAGITGLPLRRSYVAIARYMARREFAVYTMMRALAPASLQPHLLATSWFVFATDDIVDGGTDRAARYSAWQSEVRRGLAKGSSQSRELAGFLHTVAMCDLPVEWVLRSLESVGSDLEFPPLKTEDDFQSYVDDIVMPAFLVVLAVDSDARNATYLRALRPLAEAVQRGDILADMADDLREHRCFLPEEDLNRYAVSREDLFAGARPLRLLPLLSQWVTLARQGLAMARSTVLPMTPAPMRPLVGALIAVHELRLDAVERAGLEIVGRPVRPPVLRSLHILLSTRKTL